MSRAFRVHAAAAPLFLSLLATIASAQTAAPPANDPLAEAERQSEQLEKRHQRGLLTSADYSVQRAQLDATLDRLRAQRDQLARAVANGVGMTAAPAPAPSAAPKQPVVTVTSVTPPPAPAPAAAPAPAPSQGSAPVASPAAPAPAPVAVPTPGQTWLCCNLRVDGEWISDLNPSDGGRMVRAGAPMRALGFGRYRVHVESEGHLWDLGNDYSRALSLSEFSARYIVGEDPNARMALFPAHVQEAIRAGRLLLGMTREQVAMSIGWPATDWTPSLASPKWHYWWTSKAEMDVMFDDKGHVEDVRGPATVRAAALLDAVRVTDVGPEKAAAPTAASIDIAGLTVQMRDSDPLSGAPAGEARIVFSRATSDGFELNGGSLVVDGTGKAIFGTLPLPMLVGAGGNRLAQPTEVSTTLILGSNEPAAVTVRYVQPEVLRGGSQAIPGVRVSVEGYSPRSNYSIGLPITGWLVIEPRTGIVLAGELRCRNALFAFKRDVVYASR